MHHAPRLRDPLPFQNLQRVPVGAHDVQDYGQALLPSQAQLAPKSRLLPRKGVRRAMSASIQPGLTHGKIHALLQGVESRLHGLLGHARHRPRVQAIGGAHVGALARQAFLAFPPLWVHPRHDETAHAHFFRPNHLRLTVRVEFRKIEVTMGVDQQIPHFLERDQPTRSVRGATISATHIYHYTSFQETHYLGFVMLEMPGFPVGINGGFPGSPWRAL